jgi:hypothetical protein
MKAAAVRREGLSGVSVGPDRREDRLTIREGSKTGPIPADSASFTFPIGQRNPRFPGVNPAQMGVPDLHPIDTGGK